MFRPDSIIIHCSDTIDDGVLMSFDAIRKYHREHNGWRDIGYHGVIERVDNELVLIQGRSFFEKGAHCRAGGMNSHSLGLCVTGKFDNRRPSRELYDFIGKVVTDWVMLFDIPISSIQPHRHYDHSKTCPGSLFDMNEIKARVVEGLQF